MIDFNLGVKLGPLREKNLSQYFDARNHPEIWKWCRQCDVLTEQGHKIWFDSLREKTSVRMYEIQTKEEKLVGVCGLTDVDHMNQRAEFSLYIFPEHHKNGFGRSALESLCVHGFKNLNLNMIWGESFDGNEATKMFEAVGFQKEGVRRNFYYRDGKFIDAHLYSLSKNECLKRLASSF